MPDTNLSYGYRPGKSAIKAVEITRQRCWQYNWVLEFDIVGLFDNISHEMLMRALWQIQFVPSLSAHEQKLGFMGKEKIQNA